MLMQKAVPVWGENLQNEWNQFMGFRTDLTLSAPTELHIKIAARSYYRLYLDGKMVAHGPSQAPRGHVRVDDIVVTRAGTVAVAIEVAAYDKPERYANDLTLEPGMLACEITAGDAVLSFTGDDSWRCQELLYRASKAMYMSHCRGIIEVYDMDSHSMDWLTGTLSGRPTPTGEDLTWMPRRAPYPNYHPIQAKTILRIRDMSPGEGASNLPPSAYLGLPALIHRQWYEMLTPEELFLPALMQEHETAFTGAARSHNGSIILQPGEHPAVVTWSLPAAEVGFLHLKVHATAPVTLDLIHSDHLSQDSSLPANTYLSRYTLQPGEYDLISFEPKLLRYVKCIARTSGEITLSYPELLDDTYPDDQYNFFECSDGELNAIYAAARRTARLNTLDVFMDCPERERSGWLCDSEWTSRGAWMLFGDLRVEHGFLENFMHIAPDAYDHSWFPECFPSCPRGTSPGITTWAPWLIMEFYEYYHRSGDRTFVDESRPRLTAYVEGMLRDYYDPEVGLFCNLESVFVDWSLSNKSFCKGPISVPANLLFCKNLELLAELYDVPAWAETAQKVRARLNEAIHGPSDFPMPGFSFGAMPADALRYENGRFIAGECTTEAALATELWCGFGQDNKMLVDEFVNAMGTNPRRTPNPNIGRANLFIGLAIRMDVLSKLGKVDQLVRELKGVYLPQLAMNSTTLFENIHSDSGCHGFNAHAGALITQDVLGLGEPHQLTRTVRIAPHPGTLHWANGRARTKDGDVEVSWWADSDEQVLHLQYAVPAGWTAEVVAPPHWTIVLD